MKGKHWKNILIGFAILFFLLCPGSLFPGSNSNTMKVDTEVSLGETSNGGQLLLNEVCTGADYVEMVNFGPNQDMTGWQVRLFYNDAYYRTYVFPNGWLFPTGSVLILYITSGTNSGNTLYTGWSVQWTTNVAVGLMDGAGANVDWFQSQSYIGPMPSDVEWIEDASIIFSFNYASRLYEQNTNRASDWLVTASGTPGALNPGQSPPPETELPPSTPILEPISSPDTDGIIDLNWNYVENATSYFVYRDTNLITSVAELTPIGTTTTNSYQDIITTNGLCYYVIIANNADSNSSISNCESVEVVIPSATWGWTPTERVSTESLDYSREPVLAVDRAGHVHVAWHDYTDYNGSGTDVDVFYKRWNATTGKWTLTEVISSESTGNSGIPTIALDPSGHVHIAWQDSTNYSNCGTDLDIFYKRWNVTTGLWTQTKVITEGESRKSFDPKIATDLAGNIHLAYVQEYRSNSYYFPYLMRVEYRQWNSTTDTWSPPEDATSSGFYIGILPPSIGVDRFGNVHVVYSDGSTSASTCIYYACRNAKTGTWNLPERISEGYDLRISECYDPILTVDSSGNIYVIWERVSNNFWDVLYTSWNVTTRSWTQIQKISTDNSQFSLNPTIAADDFGNIHLAWSDGNDYFKRNIVYKCWNATTGSWTLIEVISTESKCISAHTAIAVDSNGYPHIIWFDLPYTSNSAGIIFYKKFVGSRTVNPILSSPVLAPISPNPDGGIIMFNWSYVSDATHYYIYRDIHPITSVEELTPIGSTPTNSYQDIINTNGLYYYVIIASNADSNSSISNCESVEVAPPTYSFNITVYDHVFGDTPENVPILTFTIPNINITSCQMKITAYCDPDDPYPRAIDFRLDDLASISIIGTTASGPGQVSGDTILPGQLVEYNYDMSHVQFAIYSGGYLFKNFIPQTPSDTFGFLSPGNHSLMCYVTSNSYILGATHDSWVSVTLYFNEGFEPFPVQDLSIPVLAPLTSPDSDDNINLNWSSVEGATRYFVYRDTSPICSADNLFPHAEVTTTSFQDSVTSDGTFYYAIVAGNAVVNSSISNCENVTVKKNRAPEFVSRYAYVYYGSGSSRWDISAFYIDADNDAPLHVNVVINGTSHLMSKRDPADMDYTDGCEYFYQIYLTRANYEFIYECSDGQYTNVTKPFIYHLPTLNPFGVTPSTGDENTQFTFTAVYTSVHNLTSTVYTVRFIINGSSYTMVKQNISDVDYRDGCVYQYITSLSPGTYIYAFECSDDIYKTLSSESELIVANQVVDTDSPYITNISPASSYINRTVSTISADLVDLLSGINASSITLLVEGVMRTLDSWDGRTLTWTSSTPFSNGRVINVELSAADNAGNLLQTSWQFMIDTTPPEVSVISPGNLTYVNNRDPITIKVDLADAISGIDASTITLKVAGQELPHSWDGSNIILSQILPYLNGQTLEVSLDASDLAGNAMDTLTWFYTIDTTPPQDFSIINPSDSITDITPEIICRIVVSHAGINLSSVQYAYSTNGSLAPTNWVFVDGIFIDAECSIPAGNGATGVLYIKVDTVPFNKYSLTDNTIRFRATDLANNEVISETKIIEIPETTEPSPVLIILIALGAVVVGTYSSYVVVRSRRKEKLIQKLLNKVLTEPREPYFINPVPVEGRYSQNYITVPEYSVEEYLTPTEYVEPVIEDQSPPIPLEPEPSVAELNFNIPYITFMQLLRIMNTLTTVIPRLNDMIPRDERLPYLMDLKSLPDEEIFARIAGLIANIPDDELIASFPDLMTDLNSREDLGHWHTVLNRITDVVTIAESQNNHQLLSELIILLLLIKHSPSTARPTTETEDAVDEIENHEPIINETELTTETPAAQFKIISKLITVIPYDDLLSQIPRFLTAFDSLENLERWNPVLNRISELLLIAESTKDRKLLNDLVHLITLIKHA